MEKCQVQEKRFVTVIWDMTGVRIMCIAVLYIPLSLPALLGGGLYTMGNVEGSHGNMVTWSLGPQPSVFIIYCRRTLKLPRDKLSQYSPGILRTCHGTNHETEDQTLVWVDDHEVSHSAASGVHDCHVAPLSWFVALSLSHHPGSFCKQTPPQLTEMGCTAHTFSSDTRTARPR